MRILVTGGAGFIGSHVLEHLLEAGHTLCVVDDLSRGRTEHVPREVPLHMACITQAGTERIVKDFAPNAVVHLAAQMDVRASTQDPIHDANVNVVGTVRLLHAAAQCGVQTFILATSGGSAYGDAENIPSSESTPVAPMSPYGASKLCDEIYLETFCRMHSMRGVALRLANVYGPRQSGSGEAGVVAIFAEAMGQNRTPVVYGDGEQTRDYIYVGDVAAAVACALKENQARGVFNIGTGRATTLNDLAKKLSHLTQYVGHIVHGAARPSEVRHSALDATRAQTVLHWSPTMSLDEGLSRTVSALQQPNSVPLEQNVGARLTLSSSRPQD